MNDSLFQPEAARPEAPPLPEPGRTRWQPLRIGVVELFHYDSEEFWFHDGHLLLRGNNGTGKSKVLSLTLPFLFDGSLRSSRIEPDGDPNKKMAWNLLLGKHERRLGYAWVEFGRVGEDGLPRYLTLGCGLSAVAGRTQLDHWFFITEQQRIGRDLWLINPQRAVLGKERLGLALTGHGQVFDAVATYRRAVDERLFHLGEARYAALMDTLIQLRQPQLSKKPDEGSLSRALTEALPPLADDLLNDVADALGQLEEYNAQLNELVDLGKAIGRFNRQYQLYARINARRRARVLRSAQTVVEKASHEVTEARAALEAAGREESRLRSRLRAGEEQLARDRAAHDEMLSDPLMRDATRLGQLTREAAARQADVEAARRAACDAENRYARDLDELQESRAHVAAARIQLEETHAQMRATAAGAGLVARDPCLGAGPLAPEALADMHENDYRQLQLRLRQLAAARLRELAVVRARLRQEADSALDLATEQRGRDERADDLAEATAGATAAEEAIATLGTALVDAWQSHTERLRELVLADREAMLAQLADWSVTLEGENPARRAMEEAQHAAGLRLSPHESELRRRHADTAEQCRLLEDERARLVHGQDRVPPAPYPRAEGVRMGGRPGAPLWQLLEFRSDRNWGERDQAGLEAALEAAGILDAWVTPEGGIELADGRLSDTFLVPRPQQAASLADWLVTAARSHVDAARLDRLLRAIACGLDAPDKAEVWVSPDGRFRLGLLVGAWNKPAAEYIGAASRAQARRTRIAAIDTEFAALRLELARCDEHLAQLAARRAAAQRESQDAPRDADLRAAHVTAAALERQRRQVAERLAQAEVRLAAAQERWRAAREQLLRDAQDLGLSAEAGGLEQAEAALVLFEGALHDFLLRAASVRHLLPAHVRQQARTEEQAGELALRRAQADHTLAALNEAAARLASLRERVGAQIGELEQRLSRARQAVQEGERAVRATGENLAGAVKLLARAEQRAEGATAILEERSEARRQAVHELERFCATGLLAVAAPQLDTPPLPWSIEGALGTARRAEQALQDVSAEDADWSRIQNAFSHDYGILLTALTALGYQAQAETTDFGMVVTIVYQNRPQRPDLIEASLHEEVTQRRALLTAREAEVLENHLQAEVAAAIQRMLREAERRRNAINAELEKRPTSTGVRFRLDWQALPEGLDGAPVGLHEARKRLLNTSFDAWSAEDRQVVGTMLQNRISAERMRADSDSGGSLLETLGRALDYRRWHRFRVLRWQDGQWRPLSGPASSGERALGLTVPLFAAVSSYYTHSGSKHAPRLVLLDEAFAGIDDAARAHCMALVREFDLDFVMTSEREWGCFAELPGVSICQLQRHEGIDAVYVSRWRWDGRARRPLGDGVRRFPPEPEPAVP